MREACSGKSLWPHVPLACGLLLLAGAGLGRDDDLIRRAREAEAKRVRLVERISPSVVAMFRMEGPGGGSGVIIDPAGYVLTNFHVVGDAKEMRVGLPGGKVTPGHVIGIDPSADLAIVRLEGDAPFPHVPIGDSTTLSVGDWTLAMGNPFLLATDFRPTVTLGIVSGLHRYQPGAPRQLKYADCIQVDTPINPGNSGGPLFDMRGQVVGINGRIASRRGRVNVGVGFAISATQIREVLSDLRAGRLVEHGYLEATVTQIEDPDSERGHRVILNQMYEDSVAALAGLELGDEILEIDGTRIRSQNHYLNTIGVLPEGRKVEVVYRRRDQRAPGGWSRGRVRIRLAREPSASEDLRAGHKPDPDHVAWETKRILRRYLDRSGARPDRVVAWVGTRLREGESDQDIHYARSARFMGRAIFGGDDDRLRLTVIDRASAKSRFGKGDWTPLEEALAADLRAEVRGLEALSSGDPAKFEAAAFVGGDKMDGRLVDVIRTMIDGGTQHEWLFDVETGDLSGYRFQSRAVKEEVLVRLLDHEEVGDRNLPFRIVRGIVGGPEIEYLVDRYIEPDEILRPIRPPVSAPEEIPRKKEDPPGREY